MPLSRAPAPKICRATMAFVVIVAGWALCPPAAEAHAVDCRIGYFSPGLDDSRSPTIHRLRAIDLPRRTDGYAPRCLVAESVAGLVKDGVAKAARKHGSAFRFERHAPKMVMVTASRGTEQVRFRIGTV